MSLALTIGGCQSIGTADTPAPDDFPEPPMPAVSAEATAGSENMPFNDDQRAVLKAVADAVTATEFCTLVEPDWPRMSERFSETGVNGNAAATTAALDAEGAAATDLMRNQRVGDICDQAIAEFGPEGSIAPGFLKPLSTGSAAQGLRGPDPSSLSPSMVSGSQSAIPFGPSQ